MVARFLNVDTCIAPYSSSGFHYCSPNPVIMVDHNGTTEWLCCYFDPFSDPMNINRGFFNNGMLTVDVGNAYLDIGDDSFISDGLNTSGNSHEPGETTLVGGGHGRDEHKDYIDRFIGELRGSGEYRTIYGNRALKTAGLNGAWRPDIIAVTWNGQYECWEIASPSQAVGTAGYDALLNKMKLMQEANPNVIFHDLILWEDISP